VDPDVYGLDSLILDSQNQDPDPNCFGNAGSGFF
jgi:hypothetical protein